MFIKSYQCQLYKLGQYHLLMAAAQFTLAFVYMLRQEFENALSEFYKLSMVCMIVLEEQSLLAVACYSNIGYLYQQLGLEGKAIEAFEKAAAIEKQLLGDDLYPIPYYLIQLNEK
ncbi:hypothetical protein TrispH2_010347 [Trichoplax sp. H2]|nr:hypothetical protein TrispH2_010347 [Trichoplax sp. H2]|eukprot:RDD39722.1 hypothetical protein TrispH2_010347 [Trichoplax sp. H2]